MVKQSSCVSVSKQEERSDSYSSSSSPTTSSLSLSLSSSTKFKGVRKRKWGKFVSEIRLPNSRERIWLGSYDTAEKAARAFDAALFCLRGRSAKFNFPNNPPEIDGGRSLSRPEIQEAAAKFANSDQETTTTTRLNIHHSDRLESPSPSPSVSVLSDETTVQLSDNEFMMMDGSFLDLMMDAGSGNVSDYGIFPGFDDFSSDFLAQPPPPPCNFDYGEENFDGVVNFPQESFLWNF